jgi:hypothetical protein
MFPRNSVIASIRDGVFPSPRSAAALPLDHWAAEPEKGTPAKASQMNKIAEDSPPISETSFSSDSVSYYLKLRQQDPPDEQQQNLPPVAPARRLGQLQDSIDVAKLRQFQQHQQPGSDFQQLQLRQVIISRIADACALLECPCCCRYQTKLIHFNRTMKMMKMPTRCRGM